MALFESYERRIDNINAVLNANGIASIEEAKKIIFKDKEAKTDIDNGIVYDIETGENIIEL